MSEQDTRRSGVRHLVAWIVVAAIVAVAAIAGAVWGRQGWRWARGFVGSDQATSTASTTAGASGPVTGSATTTSGSTTSPAFTAGSSSSGSASSAGSSATALGLVGAATSVATSAAPTMAAVTAALSKVSTATLGTVSGYVLDAATGAVLYDNGSTRMMLPASNQKVLTCSAALDVMGPTKRFTTKVVSPSKGQIVLVGGGDPYLVSTPTGTYPDKPSLAALATQTATALKAQGLKSVVLGYDDSLFSGAGWNPTWPSTYSDQVSMPSALVVDEGRSTQSEGSAATPAASAASAFAAALKARGITVTGRVNRTTGRSGSATVASVQSLPLSTIVQQVLLHSDNSAAEMVLRQVAIASGKAGTSANGVAAVQAHLVKLGVWSSGAKLVDGSGLSRSNRVSASMLARAVRVDVTSATLRPLLDGLPVAGVTGTLIDRFTLANALAGRGIAHAKSGTLTHVSSYTGYTVTKGGDPVVFSFLVNGASLTAHVTAKTPGTDDYAMRHYLDQVVATLTSVS